MQIEDFKAWHWVVVGLFVGVVFSGVLTWAGPWFDTDSLDTIDPATFEHAVTGRLLRRGDPRLLKAFHDGQPVIKDLVVHPPFKGEPTGRYWVTGKLYAIYPTYKDPTSPSSKMQVVDQWTPFKFPASAPFVGEVGATGKFATVGDYLAAVTKTPAAANVRYRFAWQETPAALWTLPPLGGLLIIGIAWPTALGAMQSFGMARPPKVRAAPKPKPAVAPVRPTPSTAGVAFVPPPSTAPQPVPAGDSKEYGGEFYPVVKPVHHD